MHIIIHKRNLIHVIVGGSFPAHLNDLIVHQRFPVPQRDNLSRLNLGGIYTKK